MEGESPYMLLVQEIVDNRKEPIPADYHSLGMKEKLYTKRSDIPSVTHVDFSGRIQTVDKRTNPQYWQLINAFKERKNSELGNDVMPTADKIEL